MVEAINKLFHNIDCDEFKATLECITQEDWDRWLAHKGEYYALCKDNIKYAVAHYASITPIPPEDIEGQANLYFCIACLRWNPNGAASLPTYVTSQLRRIGPYLVRPEARHKDNVTEMFDKKENKTKSMMEIIGETDPDNTLLEYVEKAGPDVKELYVKLHDGWYARVSKGGSSRPITAVGLYRSKVFNWNLVRCANALKGLTQALDAWRYSKSYRGYAKLISCGDCDESTLDS